MITIGSMHKRMHVALALDEAGLELDEWRGPNDRGGWESVAGWAANLGSERQWAIEGAWNCGGGLAQHLVAAGELVFDINPRWTAVWRRSARRPGKSDRLDGDRGRSPRSARSDDASSGPAGGLDGTSRPADDRA